MVNDQLVTMHLLVGIPHIFHGFTTISLGNARTAYGLNAIFKKICLKGKDSVVMEQIHGEAIREVKNNDRGRKLPKTDGMITQEKNLILTVRTADCIPLLVSDIEGKTIGVAHVGWRGLANKLLEKLLSQFDKLKVKREKLRFAIGPHIRKCCYNVNTERIRKFEQKFGKAGNLFEKRDGEYYLDTGQILKLYLERLNIKKGQIENYPRCTACLKDVFYSFRREGKTHGKIVSFIGIHG